MGITPNLLKYLTKGQKAKYDSGVNQSLLNAQAPDCWKNEVQEMGSYSWEGFATSGQYGCRTCPDVQSRTGSPNLLVLLEAIAGTAGDVGPGLQCKVHVNIYKWVGESETKIPCLALL